MSNTLKMILCVIVTLAQRLAQLTVFYPAAIVGMIFLTLQLAGESPLKEVARVPVDYAENQKSAPDGYVFKLDCMSSPESILTSKGPEISCHKKGSALISTADVIEFTHAQLLKIYKFLIILSGVFLSFVAFVNPRVFFGFRKNIYYEDGIGSSDWSIREGSHCEKT